MDVLIELADTLATSFDIDDYLHLLCARAHRLFDVRAAGVLLEGPGGSLQLSAASTDDSAALDLFEVQARQGPCFDAYRSGQQIVAADLEQVEGRWPQFTRLALQHGMRAVSAFPLRLRGDRIGAMNLFRGLPASMQEDQIVAAQALADVATIGIMSRRRYDAAQVRTDQLQWALDSRISIEQAKGIIAERQHLRPNEAYQLIRRYARGHQRTVRSVAEAIVDGALLLDEGT